MITVTSSSSTAYETGPAPFLPTIVRLKLTILKNSLFGGKAGSLWSALVLVATIGGSLFAATKTIISAQQHQPNANEHLTLLFTSLFGLWVFGPLLVGGVDDSLDPTRLALLPLRRTELRRGLAIGALLGPLPLASMISIAGAAIGYRAKPVGGPLAIPISMAFGIVAATIAMLVNVTMSRALSVSLAFAGRSRRGKDLSVLLASLGAAAIFLGTQSIRFLNEQQKDKILGGLRWLPSGQISQALIALHRGDYVMATTRLFWLAILCALGFSIWLRGVDRLLIDPDAIRHTTSRRSADVDALVPSILRRFSSRPTVILASKELRYLGRSPQRRSSLIISVVIGTVFALLQSMRYSTSDPRSVFGAVVAALFGVHATNNVLGTDAASLWMEQSAGARLKDQLVARSAAASPNLIIPTVLAGAVLAALSGGWSEFALLVAATFALIGLPLGVGSVISVIAPFNQPDSGNPYSNKRATNARGGLISLLAIVGIASVVVGAIPPIIGLALAWFYGNVIWVVAALAATVPYSLGCWYLGVRIALRLVRGRESDLLSQIGGRRAAV